MEERERKRETRGVVYARDRDLGFDVTGARVSHDEVRHLTSNGVA